MLYHISTARNFFSGHIIVLFITSFSLMQPLVCAVADTVSMRFVNGTGKKVGILGVDYKTAAWLNT